MLNDLIAKIVLLEEDDALALAKELLAKGEDPTKILDCARQGLEQVGKLFEQKEYFLPQLMMGGEIMTQISDHVKPYIVKGHEVERIGKIVFGTVEGDIHDIGKNIVAFMLDINGFEVFDLGVDVPPQKFLDKIKEVNAPILGLSGFLHFAHQSMKATIDLLEQEGLRDQVKVVIGGGQVDEYVLEYTGADGWGSDAMDAVNQSKRWVNGEVDHE
jgi:trimethylamine corrinoid protein